MDQSLARREALRIFRLVLIVQLAFLGQGGQVNSQLVYHRSFGGFGPFLASEDQLPLQYPVSRATDLLAGDAQVIEHLQSSPITLAHHPQQDVVRVYPRVAPASGLVPRQFKHSLGAGCEIRFHIDQRPLSSNGAKALDPVLYVARLQP